MTLTELLALYGWTLPVLALLAGALSFAGAHLAARGQTLLSLNTSQGADIGSLLMFIALFQAGDERNISTTLISIVGACGGAVGGGWISSALQKRFPVDKGTVLFSLWILFFAGTQILIASHPALEAHFTRALIGDITTWTLLDHIIIACISGVLVLIAWLGRRHISHATFCLELMGSQNRARAWEGQLLFVILTALSTWATGFLLTCALLFLPTTLLSIRPRVGAERHLLHCIACSVIAAPLGLVVSLSLPQLPSVPVVVASLAAVTILSNFIGKNSLDGRVNHH